MAHKPEPLTDRELERRIWSGDESAKAGLIIRYGPAVEQAVNYRFRGRHSAVIEDIVAEAVARFWMWREKFDPARVPARVCLYKLAVRVANEYSSGRLPWQKARLMELPADPDVLGLLSGPVTTEAPDEPAGEASELHTAVREEFYKLSPLQQDILQAYADAGDFKLDAGTLGLEMGRKHKDGVPVPAGTVRTIKSRAKQSIIDALLGQGFDLEEMGLTNE